MPFVCSIRIRAAGHIAIAANGLLRRRSYAQNIAHALLLAVDKPTESSGEIYNIRDEQQYTQRQRVDFIARHLGHEWEVVEVPPELAERVYKGGAARSSGRWTPPSHSTRTGLT